MRGGERRPVAGQRGRGGAVQEYLLAAPAAKVLRGPGTGAGGGFGSGAEKEVVGRRLA